MKCNCECKLCFNGNHCNLETNKCNDLLWSDEMRIAMQEMFDCIT